MIRLLRASSLSFWKFAGATNRRLVTIKNIGKGQANTKVWNQSEGLTYTVVVAYTAVIEGGVPPLTYIAIAEL
jgi:hypothetical protein